MSSLQELNWILYWPCTVQHCVWENFIRWEREGHKVFLPCLLPTCCSNKFQSFLPLLNNRFLAWLIPCMVRVTVLQPRFGSCSLMKLIKTRECNIFQSAGVWGEKPFSTGDSSQFCRIHYIPESVELCKQLSGPRGIAKPENNLWKLGTCSWTGKQIWNMIRREILLKNAENGSDKLGIGKW